MTVQGIGALAIGLAAILSMAHHAVAGQIRGEIRSIDPSTRQAVVRDEETKHDVTISLASLAGRAPSMPGKGADIKDLKPGVKVVVDEAIVASSVEVAD